ncbi:Transcriptional regulator, contains XRE-family HTH domain [Streptomyces sp. Termitarium-T10T-6]|nr:Transcriptional regulator, contains XRE-family HTH domain [Streptomyces sp. Termitarium-T10T-6]
MLEEAEEIGKRARRARLRLGIPQADLATALGKSQGWVSKMERGLIELDRVGLLNQVAAELHVHPNDLIGRPYSTLPRRQPVADRRLVDPARAAPLRPRSRLRRGSPTGLTTMA